MKYQDLKIRDSLRILILGVLFAAGFLALLLDRTSAEPFFNSIDIPRAHNEFYWIARRVGLNGSCVPRRNRAVSRDNSGAECAIYPEDQNKLAAKFIGNGQLLLFRPNLEIHSGAAHEASRRQLKPETLL